MALSVAAGLLAQTAPGWADTKADINAALRQLGYASTISNATSTQLRQAIARATYINHSSASDVATYVTDVLNQRYPTDLANAKKNDTNLTQRGTDVDDILDGGIQGLRALGDTTAADFATVTLAAANVDYQPAALDAIRAELGNSVITRLQAAVTTKFLSGISGAPSSLAANPDLAGAAAPAVASSLLSAYASRDVTRDSSITNQVLSAIPPVTGATFTQVERDASITSVITTLQGASYITPVNRDEFVARLAKGSTLTIQTVSQAVAASLADEAAREAFATAAASFFTEPNGSTGANQALIVLPDATKGLIAAGIALVSPGHEGDITSAIAGTMSNSNLTAAQQAAQQAVGSVYALDVRRGVVLGGVVAANPATAPAVTEQYLTARPITVEANAPAFAATVTRFLPVTVNPTNRDAVAGTTVAVTGVYVAAAVNDTHFQTKAGVVRAVVTAVPAFAEETVHQVALQVQTELSALDQSTVATAFAVAIAANVGASKMDTPTRALVAQGVALTFTSNEGKVAKAVADLPTSAASSAPTDASRAAIAAAVVIAVPAAAQDVVAQVGSSLGTVATTKVGFGAALIAALPATSGVTDAAKLVAASLADPAYTTFANDTARIDFAKALAAATTVTKTALNSSLIAVGVATRLADFATSAPALAAGVATAVKAPADAAPIAAAVAAIPSTSLTVKTAIAVAVTTAIPAQAVDIADQVAAPTVAAEKAVIAAAVAAVIPAGTQSSAKTGTAALAAKVAGQISVSGVNAADEIAAIAKAVAAAGGKVPLSLAPDIARAVAGQFAGALTIAAPVISSQVASVTGLTIANQAAIAKAVAAAVPVQARAVATGTLNTALTINNGAAVPGSLASTFATAIPAQAPALAGTATTFYANTYLSLHPSTTVRAGDIAVAVATSSGVTPANIPAIATQVAQAIFPSNQAAIGGIADKFASAVGTGSGSISKKNFANQAPDIATGLGTVAAPTGRESSELAGIVAALTEALPIKTAANINLIATITKNVALVATSYWTAQSVTYKADDLVGFLVAELLARGASDSVAPSSVLGALKAALTAAGSPISLATVNAVYGNAGTTGTVNLNPNYASTIGGAGLGTIGDVLSNTTSVTDF